MIDFSNASVFKLKKTDASKFDSEMRDILIEDEKIIGCYQDVRDHVVFTNKRVIAVNVQGITGKKKDFTSLPYSKIQAFSVETAGVFDLDSELDLWFSGIGHVKLEFTGAADVSYICKMISKRVL